MVLLATAAVAQEPPTRVPLPADSVRIDTVARDTVPRDSLAADSIPKDTIKAPIAVAPRGATPEVSGRRTVWDRDAIFASGAVTLPELLDQVPGVSVAHAGFMAAVSATSWYGAPGRVRVFLDGVELDAIDPREGGVRDLGVIQLWSLEEVAVERAAGELRVHLRSWRVERTTASTRTDITTGSENTNLYRGFFGKRMDNGGVLQLAAQQYSTTSTRTRGDGDALGAFGRVGVARGRLTIDAVANRYSRTRTPTIRNLLTGTPDPNGIAGFRGRDVSAYVRAAWGSPDQDGLWFQAVAATLQHIEDTDGDDESGTPDTDVDTAVSQAQYVGSLGFTRWGAQLALTGRLRVQGGEERFAPSARLAWGSRFLSVNAYAEELGPDTTSRQDVSFLVTPFEWLHLGASHSVHTPDDETWAGPARTTSRAEAGVRIARRWITAGVIRQSERQLQGMPVFDPAFGRVLAAEATGGEAGIAGPVWGPFSFSWRGIRWDTPEYYRPDVESRAEISVASSFLERFPKGNFHLSASLVHEYRGGIEFPTSGGATGRVEGAGVLSSLLDIRIGTAHLFWYNGNFNGKVYETVPGFLMPRMVQLYGVRWAFWN